MVIGSAVACPLGLAVGRRCLDIGALLACRQRQTSHVGCPLATGAAHVYSSADMSSLSSVDEAVQHACGRHDRCGSLVHLCDVAAKSKSSGHEHGW